MHLGCCLYIFNLVSDVTHTIIILYAFCLFKGTSWNLFFSYLETQKVQHLGSWVPVMCVENHFEHSIISGYQYRDIMLNLPNMSGLKAATNRFVINFSAVPLHVCSPLETEWFITAAAFPCMLSVFLHTNLGTSGLRKSRSHLILWVAAARAGRKNAKCSARSVSQLGFITEERASSAASGSTVHTYILYIRIWHVYTKNILHSIDCEVYWLNCKPSGLWLKTESTVALKVETQRYRHNNNNILIKHNSTS